MKPLFDSSNYIELMWRLILVRYWMKFPKHNTVTEGAMFDSWILWKYLINSYFWLIFWAEFSHILDEIIENYIGRLRQVECFANNFEWLKDLSTRFKKIGCKIFQRPNGNGKLLFSRKLINTFKANKHKKFYHEGLTTQIEFSSFTSKKWAFFTNFVRAVNWMWFHHVLYVSYPFWCSENFKSTKMCVLCTEA